MFPFAKRSPTLIRMAIVKNSTDNKCCRGCGEKRTFLYCWWVCKLVHPLGRTVWRFLKKLKIELLYNLAILLLGIYSEKTIIQKDTCTPEFIAVLFMITRTWEQPKMSIDGGMNKGDVVHIYNGIIRSHKKGQNNAICSNVDGPRDDYTE